jgi:DNA primase
MPFLPIKFLETYNIPHNTSGKNVGKDFVGVKCPFCDDPSTHGGFNLSKSYYTCLKCGYHNLTKAVKVLVGVNYQQAKQIINEFKSRGAESIYHPNELPATEPTNVCSLPAFAAPLESFHKTYLKKRNFNPDKLIKEWRLIGTGFNGDYAMRIIAPIYFNNQLVSYQGRDITNESELRYKACAKKDEVIHHKNILYGIDKVKSDKCIVVEGITDVWRLGPGAVATFGTGFTNEQVLLLAERFEKVWFLFDINFKAIQASFKIERMLNGLGIKSDIIPLPTGIEDPAELTDEQAKRIMEVLK